MRKMNAIQKNLMRYDNTSIHIAVLFIISSVVVCVLVCVGLCDELIIEYARVKLASAPQRKICVHKTHDTVIHAHP
jgi:hypothetical protein